jgi:probable phosphoglycerate mutase
VELILVRHAEPEWVRDGMSVDDPPLTERGHEQAELLAGRLAGEAFDQFYVSPLVRASQTAAPVAKVLEADAHVATWMEEIRNPIWHGSPAEKAEEAFRVQRARPAHERWDGLPGGESVREFVVRMRSGIAAFLAEHGIQPVPGDLPVWRAEGARRRILCVAHAGTNSVLICHLLGLEPTPWEWDRFVLGHASITRLEALPVGDGLTFSLTKLSDVEHLPAGLRTR